MADESDEQGEGGIMCEGMCVHTLLRLQQQKPPCLPLPVRCIQPRLEQTSARASNAWSEVG
jgi:hypothetical protein